MTDFVFETFENSPTTQREKTRWLEYSFGTHVVRLLTPPKRIFTHFFRGKGTIECLGRDCPVCKRNKELEAAYPTDYNKQTGYVASTPRHYANVLDRTPVKVCPQCGVENKRDALGQFPNSCTACGTVLVAVEHGRSNVVKAVNISETNAKALNALRTGVLDNDGNPRGLGTFDIAFLVSSSNGKKNIGVSATNNFDEVTVPEDKLYDVSKLIIHLEPEEVLKFMSGIGLKDIFAARRATTEVDDVVAPPVAVAKAEVDIAETLAALGFD